MNRTAGEKYLRVWTQEGGWMEFGVYVTIGSRGMDNVTIGQVSLFELYFIVFYPEVTHVLYYLSVL